MDVSVLVSFLVMGTATLCGFSLLVWLVVLERDPKRCHPAAVAAKPNPRRLGPIGCRAPTARRPAAQASAPRQAAAHLAQAARAKMRLGPGLTIRSALSLPPHRHQARQTGTPSVRSQLRNEAHHR
jgi:hypothetical protein